MSKESERREAEKKIKLFFQDLEGKKPAEIKKMKRLAMSYNIQLGSLRKKFCKKCFSRLRGKIRINNGIKSTTCDNCGFVSRWKIR